MATSRLLRISTTPSLPNKILSNNPAMVSRPMRVMCLSKVPGGGAVKTEKGLLLAYVADHALSQFITKPRPWRFNIQMFVEKAIVDCRFFTLLAISGSLLGSVLCFVEGCFLTVVSYVQYFHPLSKMSDQGHVVMKLIEAIDMFLMGTAMLVFAIALHVMFVGHDSNPATTNLKRVESAMQAKSKMGHALIMILQIQVLDKSKSIAVSNGMDLACFAASIFISSASIFLLSRTNSSKPSKSIIL
ncbi:hypothetical protein ACS0TY_023817 [Phlomoides rotata]